MSPRSSNSPAEPGIYDGLMVVACASLLAGIIFLWLHLNSYDWTLAAG